MGGSFSSKIKREIPIAKTVSTTEPIKPINNSQPVARVRNTNLDYIHSSNRVLNYYDDLQQLTISKFLLNERNHHVLITYEDYYFPKVSKVLLINPIDIHDNSTYNISLWETYKCFPIHEYTADYRKIKNMITNKFIKIKSIEEMYNPFLKKSYQLKKIQKEEHFPLLEEMQLFHGTKLKNIDNICENNLNWRLCGTGTGHRFGQGVSFSCNAMYAASYSQDCGEKVIFLSNVLVGGKCVGTKDMKLPPNGYDTTLKNATDDIVVVKYEDNEFYPTYKIKFHIAPGYIPKNKRQNINHFRTSRLYQESYSYDSDDY